MISDPGTPTLDQLRVFLTVVEVGSFAGAARKLHRATSVVSYSIANLEMQLGVSLFDRKTTRKPQLTDAGRMVLAEARTIYSGIEVAPYVERPDEADEFRRLCEEFRGHLVDCNRCEIVVDNLRQTITVYRAGEQIELPERLQAKLHDLLRAKFEAEIRGSGD